MNGLRPKMQDGSAEKGKDGLVAFIHKETLQRTRLQTSNTIETLVLRTLIIPREPQGSDYCKKQVLQNFLWKGPKQREFYSYNRDDIEEDKQKKKKKKINSTTGETNSTLPKQTYSEEKYVGLFLLVVHKESKDQRLWA